MSSTLTKKEKEFVSLLKEAKGESVWMKVIRDVIVEGMDWKIRRMIADLKSQRADDPYVMRMIIGKAANEKLKVL